MRAYVLPKNAILLYKFLHYYTLFFLLFFSIHPIIECLFIPFKITGVLFVLVFGVRLSFLSKKCLTHKVFKAHPV